MRRGEEVWKGVGCVDAPKGSGKTICAEFAILRMLARASVRRVEEVWEVWGGSACNSFSPTAVLPDVS